MSTDVGGFDGEKLGSTRVYPREIRLIYRKNNLRRRIRERRRDLRRIP